MDEKRPGTDKNNGNKKVKKSIARGLSENEQNDNQRKKENGDKKKYKNKPSEDRKVTVVGNRKLGKDGKPINEKNKKPSKNDSENDPGKKKKKRPERSTEKENNEKSKKSAKAKNNKKHSIVFVTILLFIVSVVIIASSVALLLPYLHIRGNSPTVRVQYEFYGTKSRKDMRMSQIYKDGKTAYVLLNDFSEKIGLHVLGNDEGASLYTDGGDRVVLTNGSNIAMINTIPFELSGNVIIEGKNIYIPANLFTDYAKGIDITFNESTKRLTIGSVKDEERSTSIHTVYEEFKFTPHPIVPCDPIDQDTLDKPGKE